MMKNEQDIEFIQNADKIALRLFEQVGIELRAAGLQDGDIGTIAVFLLAGRTIHAIASDDSGTKVNPELVDESLNYLRTLVQTFAENAEMGETSNDK